MKRLLWPLLCALAPAALAQNAPDESIRQFVQREAAATAAHLGDGVRIEVSVGSLPSGMQLAPCARIEPFVPAGARLWGRARVGMRCMEGANWSVLVPVTVRVFGPALVADRPLPAMRPISPDDLRPAEVEWTREPQGVVTDAAQVEGRVPVRPIGTGQPLPLAALRAPLAVSQGDPVKIVGQGRGFSIQTDGIALAAAQDGQSVRVRTDSGRILTGTARAGRTIEVLF